MTELIGMKDDKLKKRAKVFGEQLKPLAAAMLKRQIEQHNDILKMKEIIESMMKDMKDGYPLERVTESLARQTGAGVGLIVRAANALGECDGIVEGALKKLKEWAGDIQKLGDPKIDFGVKPQSKIIQPDKRIVKANLRVVPKKGGDRLKH